jgi:hypothetical protein
VDPTSSVTSLAYTYNFQQQFSAAPALALGNF